MASRVENIRLLMTLSKSSDVQSTFGVTPLMLAASAGCADCTQLLAQQSADIDIKDGAGDTALLRAVRSQHMDTVQILLQKGANQNARSISGETPAKLAERLGGPIATLFQAP
jgi:ankyrin repeat protein